MGEKAVRQVSGLHFLLIGDVTRDEETRKSSKLKGNKGRKAREGKGLKAGEKARVDEKREENRYSRKN